jgi:hypothetical protein
MHVISDSRHFGTVFEVLGVVESVVADVLRCAAAQEGMLNIWVV